MRDLGFAVADEAVLTPATSAASLFRRRGYRRVLALGHDGLAGPLRDAGLEVVTPADASAPAPPPVGARTRHTAAMDAASPPALAAGLYPLPSTADAVFVGWYPEFTMADLELACQWVWAGATLYSSSQSMFFATAAGRALGTSRAISAMIKSITGCQVRLVGKPSLQALRCAASRLRVPLADLAVVGDDPDLEVPMAHRGQSLAIAVGTGIGAADSFDHLPDSHGPHLSVAGVDELLAICQCVTADGT